MPGDGTRVDDTIIQHATSALGGNVDKMDLRVKTGSLQDRLAENEECLRRSEERQELQQSKHLEL